MKLEDALEQATLQLGDAVQARQVLSACLQLSPAELWSHPEKALSVESYQRLHDWLQQVKQGYPLAYLTGTQGFWTFDLKVTPDTLIPRPETEVLVQESLQLIDQHALCNVLELGTGSGAIAIALATERPHCHITTTEQSEKALAVAKENVANVFAHNGVIDFVHMQRCAKDRQWYTGLQDKYDLIVSNPPYVEATYSGLSQLRFEPQTALVAGEQGMDDLHHIIQHAPKYLKPHGWIVLEHGNQQAPMVSEALKAAGFVEIVTVKDLAGHARVTRACQL